MHDVNTRQLACLSSRYSGMHRGYRALLMLSVLSIPANPGSKINMGQIYLLWEV